MTLLDDINAYLGTGYVSLDEIPNETMMLLIAALLTAIRVLEAR